MATARFRAYVVRDQAARFIEDQERQRKEARDKRIAELLKTPKTTGSLWWKRTHYRTTAEAEADYVYRDEYSWYSREDRTEGSFVERVREVRPIRDLAAAALSTVEAEGFVSLSESEAALIGLAKGAAE